MALVALTGCYHDPNEHARMGVPFIKDSLQAKYRGAKPAALIDRTDLTPETITYFVRHGIGWMTPFRKTEISDMELQKLGAYLTTTSDKKQKGKKRLEPGG